MGKGKKKFVRRAAALGLSLLLTAVGMVGCEKNKTAENADDTTKEGAVQAESFDVQAEFKKTDLDDSWSQEEATAVSLNKEAISVDGEGASASGTKLTISKAGTYVVEGSLSDGQLVVEAGDEDLVRIVLNGVDIHCENSAPVYVKNADKTVIILAEGTENSLSDGSVYTYEDEAEEEPNGTIFSKDDLVINGKGSLNIEGNCNNGIVSKDDLELISGTVAVKAVNHGIKGKDSVAVKNGTYTITAGGDGIKAANSTDADKGYVYIENGTFTIQAEQDGIQAETGLKICDGSFIITSGGGSAAAAASGNQNKMNSQKAFGNGGRWIEQGTSASDNFASEGASQEAAEDAEEESASTKAVKAGIELDVLGGTFEIDSADDGFHSNSTMVITGGDFKISAGDDGFHSDAELTVEDGTIDIAKAYEGIESAVIYMKGGTISMVTDDDGLNAAGGELSAGAGMADGEAGSGRPDMTDKEAGSGKPDAAGGEWDGAAAGTGQPNMQDMPDMQGQPDMQNMSDMQNMPDKQGQPDMPDMPDMPDKQEQPNMPDMPDMQGQPDIQGQPNMRGRGGMAGGGMMESSSGYLYISGGTIVIEAEGDGVDANTDVEMSGGTVTVYGPSNDGNGSLDFGNSFKLTGGTLLTAGSSGMAMALTSETTVNTMFVNLESSYPAGSQVRIVGEDGTEIAAFTPTKDFSNIIYGAESLKKGEVYQIQIGGENAASVTMSDTVTVVGNSMQGAGMKR